MAEDPVALLPPLRDTIAAAGLAATKALGQHFLLDLNVTGKIARAVPNLDTSTVIEVGPGPGGLTRALLLAGAKKVVAIERDERAVLALQPLIEAAGGRLEVISGDALAFDYESVPGPRQIVSNLPYNVGTPLLIGWLEHIERFSALTLMFQKEVAQRIVAKPRTSDYGRLSVMSQWRCACKKLFDLPARAFTPPPKVDSSVVQFLPHNNPSFRRKPESSIQRDSADMTQMLAIRSQSLDPGFRRDDVSWKTMEKVVAAAFGQRRKMLRAALKTIGDGEALCVAAGIPPTARAEELTTAQFVALAQTCFKNAG